MKRGILVPVIGVALAAGCTGMGMNSAAKVSNLAVGMTRVEVETALGQGPVGSAVKDGKTVLKFSLHENWKGFVPYYMTFDQDGKLESWRADEEEYQRNQAQLAKTWGVDQKPADQGKTEPGKPEPGKEQPAPAGDAELQRWIAGSYMSYSGSTYRRFVLGASGTFSISTESSYSGRPGEVGGAWGAASQKGSSGRWSITGDKNSGSINLVYNNGTRKTVKYQRGRENGVFSFDGITFAYEAPAK